MGIRNYFHYFHNIVDKEMSLSYEFITGKRRDSKILYVKSEKQLYTLKSTCLINKKNYYNCYITECKARVVLLDGICEKIKNSMDHNHPDQEETYNQLEALNAAKKNWLECEQNLSQVGVGGRSLKSVKASYRQLCSKMSVKGPNERKKYKPRFVWRLAMEQVLLNIWSERADEIRGPRKNIHIFDEIAEELLSEGITVSPHEVKIKIYNLITKFKKEKKSFDETGNPSDWQLFDRIQTFYIEDPSPKESTTNIFKAEKIEDVCDETETEGFSYIQPELVMAINPSSSNDVSSPLSQKRKNNENRDEDPFKRDESENLHIKDTDLYAGVQKLNENLEKLLSYEARNVSINVQKLELKEKKMMILEKQLVAQVELKDGALKFINDFKTKYAL